MADNTTGRAAMSHERLSDEAAQLLHVILTRTKAMTRPEPDTIEVQDAVDYLVGAASGDRRAHIEYHLSLDGFNRDLLRSVHSELAHLKSIDWRELSERSTRTDFGGEVARCWMNVVSTQVRDSFSVRDSLVHEEWSEVRQAAEAGIEQARSAWNAIRAFAKHLSLETQVPRMAYSLGNVGGERQQKSIFGIPMEVLSLHATLASDGVLNAEISLEKLPEEQRNLLYNLPVYLVIQRFGETVKLGRFQWKGDTGFLTIPEFGTSMSLMQGSLPQDWLGLIVDAEIQFKSDWVMVYAETIPGEAHAPKVGVLAVEIQNPVTVQDGRLIVEIKLPSLTRTAAGSSDLELYLQTTPTRSQLLGHWPVSTWNDDFRALTVDCPGIASGGELPVTSLWFVIRETTEQ